MRTFSLVLLAAMTCIPAVSQEQAVDGADPADVPAQAIFENQAPETPPAEPDPAMIQQQEATLRRILNLLTTRGVVWPVAPEPETDNQPADDSAAQVLLELTLSVDPIARKRGLEGLAGTDIDIPTDVFINGILDHDADVRAAAFQLQDRLDEDDLFTSVMVALLTGDVDKAAFMEAALPRLKPVIEDRLIQVLDSEKESLEWRAAAAFSLGRMRSEKAVDALLKGAWSADPFLAVTSAEALLELIDYPLQDALASLTRHPMARVRVAALHGLAALGNTPALIAIGEVAAGPEEPDRVVRTEAIELLGQLGGEADIHVLMAALKNQPYTWKAVVASLEEITGLGLGEDPNLWRQWYNEWVQTLPQSAAEAETETVIPPPIQTGTASP